MVLTDIEPREETAPQPDRDWWRGCVIYQIYPRSFQDSNADGIGDLAGIIQRLPYVASLGVDAIWISPFMKSPMADFGYDVSSYRDVDPMFGTLGDFDALIARAHELGIRVIIDLVLSTVQCFACSLPPASRERPTTTSSRTLLVPRNAPAWRMCGAVRCVSSTIDFSMPSIAVAIASKCVSRARKNWLHADHISAT